MSRPHASHQVRFNIARLVAWAPGVATDAEWTDWQSGAQSIRNTGEPALQQMQPLLRRHAGRLGRFACSVAYDSVAGRGELPVVFSSRYGEVSRSVELLTALATREELSPASFGLSVHNAIPGLFSMARKDTANSVSLAAGDEAAEYGVLEACSLLGDGAAAVLLVVADVPLPPIYARFADTTGDAYGWACILTQAGEPALRLEWSDAHEPTFADRAEPETPRMPGALAVLPFLQGHQHSYQRASGARGWNWRHNDE